jgi:carbon-monoxide dehydrogenase large subunit
VSDIRMPLTPERVWRAIHLGGDGGDRAPDRTNAQAVDSAQAAAIAQGGDL